MVSLIAGRAHGGREGDDACEPDEDPVLAAHDAREVEGGVFEEVEVVEGLGGWGQWTRIGWRGTQAGGAREDVDPDEGGDEVF